MKTVRILISTILASFIFTIAAQASDPSGTWKWTTEGRNGSRDTTATFEFTNGHLSGSISGRDNDITIENASFEDDSISFSITMSRNGNSRVISYEGKIEGDTITGKIERSMRGNGSNKIDWKATKQN